MVYTALPTPKHCHYKSSVVQYLHQTNVGGAKYASRELDTKEHVKFQNHYSITGLNKCYKIITYTIPKQFLRDLASPFNLVYQFVPSF